jgi:hypothetical protein
VTKSNSIECKPFLIFSQFLISRFDEALRDFRQVLALRPGHKGATQALSETEEAQKSLGYAAVFLERGDPKSALGHLDQVTLKHAPDCVEVSF